MRSLGQHQQPALGVDEVVAESGCRLSAWLAGIVHGVVVQIDGRDRLVGSAGEPEGRRELVALVVAQGKATSTARSTLS